jgi:hypothetical protein
MLPDGRKLQRKRSNVPPNSIPANAPIPMHVPLSAVANATNQISHMPSQGQLTTLQGQEMKGKEKYGRRLSKRRNDF